MRTIFTLLILFYLTLQTSAQSIFTTKFIANNQGIWCEKILELSDGGFLMAGSAMTTPILIRTDSLGSLLWNLQVHADAIDDAIIYDDSSFIISGGYSDSLYEYLFIRKYDFNGNEIWTKSINTGASPYSYSSLLRDVDGGIILSNSFYPGSGLPFQLLAKLDSTGNSQWVRQYSITGHIGCHSVVHSIDSGYILIGSYIEFGSLTYYPFIIKVDDSGNILWNKIFFKNNIFYGGPVISLAPLSDGYLMFSRFDGVPEITRLDRNGTPLLSKDYNIIMVLGESYFPELIPMYDSTFQMCNTHYPLQTISRIDLNGDVVSAISVPFYGTDVIRTDDGGYAFLTLGADDINHPIYKASINKTDSLFNIDGCIANPHNLFATPDTVIFDSLQLFVSSGFSTQNIIIPTSSILLHEEPGCLLNHVAEIHRSEQIVVFPNPTSGIFTIDGLDVNASQILVINTLGKIVFEKSNLNFNQSTYSINVDLPRGYYLINVINKNKEPDILKLIVH